MRVALTGTDHESSQPRPVRDHTGLPNDEFDLDLDVIDSGRTNAYGLGGSVMLDFERYRADYEIDVEIRYTNIQLRSFGGTTKGLEGESEANSASLCDLLAINLCMPEQLPVVGKGESVAEPG